MADTGNTLPLLSTDLGMTRRRFIVAAGAFVAGVTAAPLWAASSRDEYAKVLTADPSLRGYWRFEGDLIDVMGKASAATSGPVAYVDGATAGQAINLVPRQPLSVAKTDHLRGRAATLELFFRLVAPPSGEGDPVLIAQTAGQQVRYVVGVKHDLSGLIYRNVNGDVLTSIHLPTARPIEPGRWYHLVITSFDLDLRAYVDGYECTLVGGAFEFTRAGPKESTMTFGATTLDDWGSAEVSLDEVACYDRGLTQADVQAHLRAAGWEDRLKETGHIVARVEAERSAQRARKGQAILNDPALLARGKTRVYEGDHLRAISFTVGGIGAGGIQYNGQAEPAIWQIACNFAEKRVADSFFAIRVQSATGRPVVRALQTTSAGPFAAMPSLTFEGEYPFARYRFGEPALPVVVDLEVFNPFIPMDLKHSAIPCAINTITVTNSSAATVEVAILAAQQNALGYAEGKDGNFGLNQNRVLEDQNATLLHMTREGLAGSDMVLMTSADGATGTARWDSLKALHDTFTASGSVDNRETSDVSAPGTTVGGALSVPLTLEPGETKSVTFVLTWFFTAGKHGTGKTWSHEGQNYTNWWPNARAVAVYLRDNLEQLTARTRLYHDTLYASNLPVWLLDRCSSQVAVLRSQTFFWAADGYLGAWEGCSPATGCCPGNCTHVYHYAQAHARLLPELARKMREQDYALQTDDGLTPYRHTNTTSAGDGHFGTILSTYREHLCSPDDAWLRSQWPKVKRAIDWGISRYNPKRDGFLQTVQHNTLDGDMTGCSSWIGTLYLSSLEAAARMAEVMDDAGSAADYRRIRDSGKRLQNERLWNGEYYIQQVGERRIQDYLDGCHIDQLLGEWWADQIDIDRNYPEDRSREAMQSLLKYNFRADFHGQSLKPRQYCEVDDGGMKMITWPKGPQPIPGMKYGDEVMTGFEYSAAVAMIQNGLLREGLMVLKVISDRYDGRLRTDGVTNLKTGPWGYSGNPFGDDECGKFYGRSLSVWSVLLALQGFLYDGPRGRIGFAPRWQPDNHASLFTAANGYGLYTQLREANRLTACVDLREGQLRLTEVVLALPEGRRPGLITVKVAGDEMTAHAEIRGQRVTLRLQSECTLHTGSRLDVEMAFA